MRILSVGLATLSLASFLLPGRWWLAALGFGVLAIGAGLTLYRQPRRPRERLTGACAAFVGSAALALGVTKVGLTLAAIHHIAASLG